MKEPTVSTKRANILGLLTAIPIITVMAFLFWFLWSNMAINEIRGLKKALSPTGVNWVDSIITIFSPVAVISVGAIVHEFIHGIVMLVFTKKIKSVKIGFRLEILLPYAHCKEPLTVFQMLIVVLAPWIVLGLIPFIISLGNGSVILWFVGVSMTILSVGDFIYTALLYRLSRYYLVLDHDSKIGFYLIDNNPPTQP
jgi:hypothetical protein